ncbi:MAG: hypothetical protein NC252_03180 [Roseburia sp.]|nr:hypothetical protein [Roseburia sp.]
MDFFVTCRNGGETWGKYNTHTRGSFSFADAADGGIINHFYPNSSMTLDEGCATSPVPVVSHETGQFQTYPDFGEIKKYTGVLYPYNMEVFRKRIEKAGMVDQTEDFHRASGAWSTLLYKADIELDLRTKSMGGFQLLDIQDYPGQGSAYIGILDAFMEPKGMVSPKEWCGFCSPIVPLFATDKFCYTNKEQVKGKILLANYRDNEGLRKWLDGRIAWRLETADGHRIKDGVVLIPQESMGLTEIGEIDIDLSDIEKAERLNLVLDAFYNLLSSKCYTNTYPLWAYPTALNTDSLKNGIIITKTMTDDIGRKLSQGANYRPIVQVIDNVERNHKLGLIFEFKVDKGKILVCMSDLIAIQEYPEARQMYHSILNYMLSDKFWPTTNLSLSDLHRLLTSTINKEYIEELNNISL